MSKIIRIAPEQYDQLYQEFLESLRGARISNGKITYTKTFEAVNRKATVFFSEKAWLKMEALISGFEKEVGWHGVAYRDSDATKDNYYISDIIVFPQEVTGATVVPDQKEYEKWLMSLDDETFNNLRMHGHSHVNMPVTPSSVDEKFYEDILDRLDQEMFYIFMIWNKKGAKTIKIYDFQKNVFFDTGDCTLKILEGDYGLTAFVDHAKSVVKDKAYSAGRSNYTTYKTPTYAPAPVGTANTTSSKTKSPSTSADDIYDLNTPGTKKPKRKGKRKASSHYEYAY